MKTLLIITILSMLVLATAAADNDTQPEMQDSVDAERNSDQPADEPTPSVVTTELPDFTSYKDTSTFSCEGKITGYYADTKLHCRVYHFCTQMENLGVTTYQRMSYICLEGSIFDQRDLNCVRESDLKVPCDRAEAEYESSNKQFDAKEESQPSMTDNLAANIMMNPITRLIAGRR